MHDDGAVRVPWTLNTYIGRVIGINVPCIHTNKLTWCFVFSEIDVDEHEVHDDGAVRVPRVAEHVHLLEPLPVYHSGVDGRERHVVQPRPLLSQQ